MRALEDVRNQVRSLTSRRYIEEAVAAYSVGAYRAALISTWIAVAADVIGKIRLMAEQGGAAARLRDELDRAIKANNVPALQEFERKLVGRAHTELELIGSREAEDLDRLYKDRHLCAHPAFASDGEDLFTPTPELVRAHLASAVDSLLAHPAITGRKAIERFGREASSASFPQDDTRLNEYLRASYMDYGTKALKANLIKVVCKETLKPETELKQRWTYTRTAQQLQKIAPSLFDEQLNVVLGPSQNLLTDEGLMALISGLCYVPGTWNVLHDGTRARVEELLRTVKPLDLVETHMLFYGPLPPAPVDGMLLDRLEDITAAGALRGMSRTVALCLGEEPDPRLVPALTLLAAKASSYEGGAAVLQVLNDLVRTMTDEQMAHLLEVCQANGQIRGSVLGNRQIERMRWHGPQGELAQAAWEKWDAPRAVEAPEEVLGVGDMS
ncbi:hypothetical protein GCM10010329_22560 [Streptomyces spiroverticillatus]|uniref:Uncharacterized protein n=1 Tax=Streptomyces finlayi TaxID=67296 RepID=A0A918WUR0_9ACTN|nr:hypothetical protein [Streptomyces finlayi]GHA00283.1 hypothetical protein GCM10010329_22560 [Streptomyces spiroverticillatus]GHC84760.1 hypothetical protein GCM10010334_14990 [Streptomyces finlayi]